MSRTVRRAFGVRWLLCGALLAVAIASPAVGFRDGKARVQCFDPPGLYHPDAAGHDQFVASLASDIFVGRVTDVQGGPRSPTEPDDVLHILYREATLAVEVLEVVKGRAAGTITVHAGILSVSLCWARLFDPPFHDPPLRRGDRALFATEFIPRTGQYELLNPDDGYYQIADEAESAALVARFTAAVQATPVASPIAETVVGSPTAKP